MSDLPPGFELDAAAAPAAAEVPPPPPGFVLDEGFDRADPRFSPGAQAAGKFLEGIPIAGAYVPQLGAAASAAAHSLTGVGSPGESFGERYDKNLAQERAASKAVDAENPALSTGAKVAGSVIGMIPAVAMAPAAFGVAGASLPASMAAGALTGGGIGAVDALARGQDPVAAAKFGAGGGAAGPLLGKAVGKGAEWLLNRSSAKTAAHNEIAEAAGRLDVDLPAIVATDNLALRQAGSVIKEFPVMGTPIVKGASKASEQMGEALKRTEQGFGSGSVFNAGDVAKTALTDWIGGKSKAVMNRVYSQVDNLVNPSIHRELDATRAMVANIAADRVARADKDGTGKAVEMVLGAVQRPFGLNYEGVKGLRTTVGEMLDNPFRPADVIGTELKRIYGALTQDLKATVQKAGGPAASKAFDRANSLNQVVSQRREQLRKVVGVDADAAPEKVLDRLIGFASGSSRADQLKLMLARKTVGTKNWDEVASAAVSRMGRDADGNFSAAKFLTSYGNNRISPVGKRLLFGSTGKNDLVQALDDIATLSRRAQELAKFSNSSGTARSVTGASTVMGGIVSPALIPGITAGLVGGRLFAHYLARSIKPKTLRTAAQNADIRALLEHATSAAGIGGVSGAALGRPPLQIMPSLPMPIQ